ncbi:hypothetical protein QR680_016210 [Steinernema hermaphroditum]|uniref:BTB domain-containing protein n=1 Tax=Steinernema hermaphroditum TaxID=289476 RepID=A0AA39HCL6_9BILA|nr:hypothetical protein QR680_016210 [Steinernema hermaphroditum]
MPSNGSISRQNSNYSGVIEAGGLRWFVRYYDTGSRNCVHIWCSADDKKTTLWSCEAKGYITIYAGKRTISKIWARSFNFMSTAHEELGFGVLSADDVRSRIIDLSSPNNEMIESPEDAARVEVLGANLWLSKKILSVHSPFFKTMFYGSMKQKADDSYNLSVIALYDLKHLLARLYNVDVPPISDKSFMELLSLADMYQCDSIITMCRDYLRSSSSMSLQRKIVICDRHHFFPLLKDIIETVSLDELKEFVIAGHNRALTEDVHCLIAARLVSGS